MPERASCIISMASPVVLIFLARSLPQAVVFIIAGIFAAAIAGLGIAAGGAQEGMGLAWLMGELPVCVGAWIVWKQTAKFHRDFKQAKDEEQAALGQNERALQRDKELEQTLAGSEHELEELLNLYEVTKDLASQIQPDRIFLILKRWSELNLKSLGCALWIRQDGAGASDVPAVSPGRAAERAAHGKRPPEKWMLAGSAHLRAEELAESALDAENQSPHFLSPGLLVVPMAVQDDRVGVLVCEVDKKARQDVLLNIAEQLAQNVALALERSRLFQAVDSLSRTDGLTGLLRRRALDSRIKEEIVRARRYGTSLSIIMADVDKFKQLNDTYGHQAGDEVLKKVARVFQEGIYETDIVGRYGGEEFLIVLLGADRMGAFRKAERLRMNLAAAEVDIGLSRLKVTASFGVAHWPEAGRESEEVVAAADAALYRAKETGRNKVVEYRRT